jgi:hypothetical protein
MKVLRIGILVGVLAVCGVLATLASAGNATPASSAQQAGETTGLVNVNFVIDRFVRQGRRIVAKGAVVSRYQSATAAPVVTRKAFTARLATKRVGFSSTARICNVLSLSLGPLNLNLLGLMIRLSGANPTDPVVLTITADSNGGLLGSLFCSLAGGGATATPAKLRATAARMTRAAQANGLNKGFAGFRFQVAPGLAQVGQICTILDLRLGPLDLNLLGLMIHLDPVHLLITAQRGGGILGDLLCGLAGGTPVGPATPALRTG